MYKGHNLVVFCLWNGYCSQLAFNKTAVIDIILIKQIWDFSCGTCRCIDICFVFDKSVWGVSYNNGYWFNSLRIFFLTLFFGLFILFSGAFSFGYGKFFRSFSIFGYFDFGYTHIVLGAFPLGYATLAVIDHTNACGIIIKITLNRICKSCALLNFSVFRRWNFITYFLQFNKRLFSLCCMQNFFCRCWCCEVMDFTWYFYTH